MDRVALGSVRFSKWRLSEDSKCIGINCEEMALGGTIEALAIHSARIVTIQRSCYQNRHHFFIEL